MVGLTVGFLVGLVVGWTVVINFGVSCETPYPTAVDEVAIDWKVLVLQAKFTLVAVREDVGRLEELNPASFVHTYERPFKTLTVSKTILQLAPSVKATSQDTELAEGVEPVYRNATASTAIPM